MKNTTNSRRLGILLGAIASLIVSQPRPIWAQPVAKPALKPAENLQETNDAQVRKIRKNDTVVSNVDVSYLVPAKLFAEMGRKADSLESLRRERDRIRDTLATKADSLIMRWKKVDSIQNVAYDSLFKLNRRGDTLLSRSIENTDKAISTARAIRRQSYITATALGAVAGLVVDKSALGGGIGAAVGFALNGCLLKFEF